VYILPTPFVPSNGGENGEAGGVGKKTIDNNFLLRYVELVPNIIFRGCEIIKFLEKYFD